MPKLLLNGRVEFSVCIEDFIPHSPFYLDVIVYPCSNPNTGLANLTKRDGSYFDRSTIFPCTDDPTLPHPARDKTVYYPQEMDRPLHSC